MEMAPMIISVVALLVAFGAMWYARQQSLAAQEHIRLTTEQLEFAKSEAEKYRVSWKLEERGKDLFALVNDGEHTEYDVELAEPIDSFFTVRTDSAVVDPQSSIIFWYKPQFAGARRNIEVTWSRTPGSEKLHWTGWCPESIV